MASIEPLVSLKKLEEEFPRLSLKITPTHVSDEWAKVTANIGNDVKDIIDPPEQDTQRVTRRVEYVRLIMDEEGKYHLLVHRNNLTAPLQSLIVAYQRCLERLDIKIESVRCPHDVEDGPACPSDLHPRLKSWIRWLSNPSTVDWKDSSNRPNISHFVKFVDGVITSGKQQYLTISRSDSRSAMYINSIINTLCRLFLVNREKWIKAIWHNIPREFRKLSQLQFHNLRLFRSICLTCETESLPVRIKQLEELQVTLIKSFLDLTGTSVQHKLRRISDEIVRILGRPALRVIYDRLKIRRSLMLKGKKDESIKLADVLSEGIRTKQWCCAPYMVLCAMFRKNIFYELMNSRLGRTFREDPADLPFGCKSMRDLALYCRDNKDDSPASSRELSEYELIPGTEPEDQ